MVARGTYSELQGSGLDFTSLLKEDEGQEEERQDTTPIPVSNSVSSMSSLSSSQYSLIDGAVVGVFETLNDLSSNFKLSFESFTAGKWLVVHSVCH